LDFERNHADRYEHCASRILDPHPDVETVETFVVAAEVVVVGAYAGAAAVVAVEADVGVEVVVVGIVGIVGIATTVRVAVASAVAKLEAGKHAVTPNVATNVVLGNGPWVAVQVVQTDRASDPTDHSPLLHLGVGAHQDWAQDSLSPADSWMRDHEKVEIAEYA
jgi:hypothetical protein